MKNWAGKVKLFFKKFFLIEDTPHKIAAGAALGIFLGIFPGEGVASTLLLATLLKFNRLAAMSGVLLTNMWSTLVVLPFAALTGALIFGKNYLVLFNQYKDNLHLGFAYFFGKVVFLDLTLPLLVGFLVVSALIALVAYFIFFTMITRHHRKNDHLLMKD
jgi:uncharacterized protein (DUF2062 family)